MHCARLIAAACILAASGPGLAYAQVTEPFKVLEQAKRDRLDLDRRLAQEAVGRRQKEKADQAARLNAERMLQKQSVEQGGNPPVASGPSHQTGALPAADQTVGTAIVPTASGTVPNGSPASIQLPSSPEPHAATAHSIPTGIATGMAASGQAMMSARAPEVVPQAPTPSAVETSAAIADPVSNPSVAPSPRGVPGGTPVSPVTRVQIAVDKAAQRMRVTVDGELRHSWPVSTGRAEFETPAGTFRPLRLAKEH